ncbi:hypothetical protein [Litoribrevibacter albus]|uniref:DUF2163 domain-containing protein n=1 Tax=Litoribrevibacter albus TaxID=1473156 RepID=A0AA37SBW4_9GAMM|nr:hypothetical protein [Litoribrevibacter albus]GLQ31668.1 hypothetical protein GCM10007876_21470 [Litoribrevibacter albus]
MLSLSSLLRALLKKNHRFYHTIEINLSNGAIRVTDSAHDVSYDGNNYVSGPDLIQFGEPKSTTEIRSNEITVTLSAIDPALRAVAFAADSHYLNQRLVLTRHYLDDSGLLVGSIVIFSGVITKRASSSGNQDVSISFSSASWWAAFEKMNGVETTNASQQRWHPTDKGFEHCPATALNIRWGSK